MLIAGLSGHYNSKTAPEIPALWQRFVARLDQIPGRVGGVEYGLCFSTGGDEFDYVAGVEISSSSGLPDGFETFSIPAHKQLVFPHEGHVSSLQDTITAIWRDWFPAHGQGLDRPARGIPDVIEYYGERFSPQTGTGDIEVWIPVTS
jgi:AraC family transcriptional regulator